MTTTLRHAAFLLPLLVGCCMAATPELVSQSGGTPAGTDSGLDSYGDTTPSPVIDDGTVFFLSTASFLQIDDNGMVDLYRQLDGTVTAVSVAGRVPFGTAYGNAQRVAVAANGQTVALLRDPSVVSAAPALELLDLSGSQATSAVVSYDMAEVALSGDGTRAAFVTLTDGLFPPFDDNNRPDLFYYQLAEGVPSYIPTEDSPSSTGISGDGGRICFVSTGRLYVRDIAASTTTRVEAAGSNVTSAAISGDGQWVAFASAENSLVSGDVDGLGDVFRVALGNGAVERLSRMPLGHAFAGGADLRDCPAVSTDGRFVAFGAAATAGGPTQIWVRDATLGRTACVSVSDANSIADADCRAPAMAPGGRYVTFCSASTNLGDANGVRQVYRTDLGVSWGQAGPAAPATALVEDLSDIVAWQWVDGHASASDYEISLDGGVTWFVAAANPCWIGNVTAADGHILIRLKATDATGSGDYLALSGGATQNGGDVSWAVAIVNADLGNTAVFGMGASAVSVAGIPPAETTGGICLLGEAAAPLASDLRADSTEADWLLDIRAPAEADASWVWTIPDTFPAGYHLSVWELDTNGEPVGGTAFVLAEGSELDVVAGEERFFALRFAADRTIDVALTRGWNLLSLPIAPEYTLLAEVFVVDGEAVVSDLGRVWDPAVQNYAQTSEIPGISPCWVYARRDARVLVRGTAASRDTLEIVEGLNLLAVSQPVAAASLAAQVDLTSSVLLWDAPSLRYKSVSALVPGGAYWLRSSETVSLPVSLLAAP